MASYMDRQYAKLERQKLQDELRRDREERKERELEARLARDRDREETRQHREWQREESLRRQRERDNRALNRDFRGSAPEPIDRSEPRPAAAPAATAPKPGGIGILDIAAMGIGAALGAAAVISRYAPRGTSVHRDADIVCVPAPARAPVPARKPEAKAPAIVRRPAPSLTAEQVLAVLLMGVIMFGLGMSLGNLILHTWSGMHRP